MAIGTSLAWGNGSTIALSIVLAFVFGYALTMRSLQRSGLTLREALRVALAADTLSIAVMETVDNTVIITIPGAIDAGLDKPLFWGSLALSLVVAFLLTTPVNRWMISRGKGHAVAHAHHR